MIGKDARPTPYEAAIARWENEGGAPRFAVQPEAPKNIDRARFDQISPVLRFSSPPSASGTNTRKAAGRER